MTALEALREAVELLADVQADVNARPGAAWLARREALMSAKIDEPATAPAGIIPHGELVPAPMTDERWHQYVLATLGAYGAAIGGGQLRGDIPGLLASGAVLVADELLAAAERQAETGKGWV